METYWLERPPSTATFKYKFDSTHIEPGWQRGYAADCRSALPRFKSGPWLAVIPLKHLKTI